MDDCIFCRIVRGEIPADRVYEDDRVLAFLDVSPANPGHTLIIPKHHRDNFAETPDEEFGPVFSVAKKVARAAVEAVGASGYNVHVNVGPVAGQVVMHTHVHVIPRFPDDGHKHWGKKEVDKDRMREIRQGMVRLMG